MPVAASSKVIQLYSIISARDSGQVSAATWTIASYAASGMIFCFTMNRCLFICFRFSQCWTSDKGYAL